MSIEELQEHSPVGPSSGERWLFCPGSVPVTKDLPDITSEFAEEGTFAHYITELARNERKDAIEYKGMTSDDGKWVVDQEMVNGVQDFIDHCEQYDGDTFVELRVHYDEWVKNGFGTSDHIAIDELKRICFINDFKYGKGIKVNAKGNIQLKLYALGVLQDLGHLYEIDEFLLAINQPRIEGGHRDEWRITTANLMKWVKETVVPGAKRVYEALDVFDELNADPAFLQSGQTMQESNPEYFRAGGWCQWCKVKGECVTRQKMISASAIDEMEDVEPFEPLPLRNIGAMSDEALGEAAAMVDQIKKWCVDIMDVVQKRVMAGSQIPSGKDWDDKLEFFKMVAGRSNRVWKDEKEAEKALRAARVKADDLWNKKLISAPAAEKLLGAEHPIFTKKDLVYKPPGSPTLVPGSDNRDPYTISTDELDDVVTDDDEDDWDV